MKYTFKIPRWLISNAAAILSVIGAVTSIALDDFLFAIAFMVSAISLRN